MPHIADGTPCHAVPFSEAASFIGVGWLNGDAPFSTGPVTQAFFRLLCSHLKAAWQPPFAAAGMHHCDLCQFGDSVTHFEGAEFSSASHSELFIPTGHSIFVAPAAIGHYIAAHHYLPPQEFIAAVEACPPQRSTAYLRLLLESGGREWLAALDTPPPADGG